MNEMFTSRVYASVNRLPPFRFSRRATEHGQSNPALILLCPGRYIVLNRLSREPRGPTSRAAAI